MLRRKAKANDTGPESGALAPDQLYELIASRAYELYEMRGAGAGDDLCDWLTAEREILTGMQGLKSEAADNIAKGDPAPAPESRKIASKVVSLGGSRKKAGATSPRSPAKPKGAHP